MRYYAIFSEEDDKLTDKKKTAEENGLKDKSKRRAKMHRTKKDTPVEIKGFIRAVPVIMIAAALFLTLCFITAETGAFGKFISNVLMGLFSYMAYTIPVFIAIHAIFFYNDVREHRLGARVVFSASALVILSMIAYIIPNISSELVFNATEFYKSGTHAVGGGFIGSVFAFALAKIFGKVGLIIVIALAIALYVLYLVSGGGSNLSRFFLKKLGKIANYFASLETKSQEKKNRKKEEKLVKQRALDEKKNAELYNDEYFGADNGVSTLEIPELGILETRSGAAGTPILRETVIKPDENSDINPEKDTSERKKRFADINLDANPVFVRTDMHDGASRADIVYEEVKPENTSGVGTAHVSETGSGEATHSTDDSADSVFTESFDPFDIAVNERRASKLSSRAVSEGVKPRGFSEYITEMTPEQLAQKRRLEEFERNRQAAIARKAAREAELHAKAEAIRQNNEQKASAVNCEPTSANTVRETEREISYTSSDSYTPAAAPSASSTAEDPATIAERKRQREQARLATIIGGEPEAPAGTSAQTVSPIPEIHRDVPSMASDANEHNTHARTVPANDRYRFVGATAEEPRRPYSSGEATVISEPIRNTAAYTPTPAAPMAQTVDTPKAQVAVAVSPAAQTVATPITPAAQTIATPIAPAAPAAQTIATPAAPSDNVKYAAADSESSSLTAAYKAPVTQTPSTDNIWEDITPANNSDASVSTASGKPAQEFNFDAPASGGAREFTFDEPAPVKKEEFDFDSEEPAENPRDTDTSEATLEVTRTVLEPTLEYVGAEDDDYAPVADDEDEDEELDESELEAEEAVERQEIPEDERNPEIYAQRQMFDVFKGDDNEVTEESDSTDADVEAAVEENAEESDSEYEADDYSEDENDDEPPFEDYEEAAPAPAPAPREEKKKPVVADYSNYKFPPLDLLKKSPEEDSDSINKEIQAGGDQLINTLDSFNIKATIRGMEHGPRITRYSIVPAKGVRVNQIEKLADDIALALAAESIRIEAPIPGKSAVGVEVPNKVPSIVSLRDLLEAEEFRSETSKTFVCIGKSVEGSLVYGDIGSMPHVLIAGATGMGKSVCINSLITSMLYKARPDEVKFIMIDPKKVEFAPYNGIPHLLVPVVTEPKQAAGALMWAVDEMNKRYGIIEKLCVKSIDSYNKKVAENPEIGAPMPKIVIFIDELNDLMVQVRDPVENLIMLIAQKARAAGIHLVIGTQRPSVDVITGVIKANIPSRIACKVSSGIDSRTILEQTGAEKLIGKGDMLFAPSGKVPKRVQGAFVSEDETESIVEFIKAQVKGEIYDEQALEDMRRAAQKCDKSKDGADDDDDDDNDGIGFLRDQKFLNAVELAIRNGSVATSFLQRKLKIGYGKAAQYIDIMEDQGIVGEKNGAKAREVKMTMQEWRELLSRRLDD